MLGSWGAEGRAEAARRLGYRLRLDSLTLPEKVNPGGTTALTLTLTNEGYAAPLRPRPARLILASPAGTHTVTLPLDVRTLAPGQHTNVTMSLTAPSLEGTYALYLVLPDASSRLAADPAYAVRLANADTWNGSTGWNDLHQTLTVTRNASSPRRGLVAEQGPSGALWQAGVSPPGTRRGAIAVGLLPGHGPRSPAQPPCRHLVGAGRASPGAGDGPNGRRLARTGVPRRVP